MIKKYIAILVVAGLSLLGCNSNEKPSNIDSIVGNRCVLVGINKYPVGKLNGCVNDVYNIKSFLVGNKYFKENEITVIIDEKATKNNIVTALEKMVAETLPSGRAFFHYSGHGTQVMAAYGDTSEPDGLYESVCPVDFAFNYNGTARNAIIDKDFVRIFSGFKQGVIFNWFSDSCYSGDLDKLPQLNSKARSFPVPNQVALAIKSKERVLNKIEGDVLDVGFVSGCRSDQTSADAWIDWKSQGAFTYYMVKTLKANPGEALEFVTAKTRLSLEKAGYTQRPTASGTRINKSFLQK